MHRARYARICTTALSACCMSAQHRQMQRRRRRLIHCFLAFSSPQRIQANPSQSLMLCKQCLSACITESLLCTAASRLVSQAVNLHGVVVGSQDGHAIETGTHGGSAGRKPARADECGPLHCSQHARVHIYCHSALLSAPLGSLDGLHKRCCFSLFHLQRCSRRSKHWQHQQLLAAMLQDN